MLSSKRQRSSRSLCPRPPSPLRLRIRVSQTHRPVQDLSSSLRDAVPSLRICGSLQDGLSRCAQTASSCLGVPATASTARVICVGCLFGLPLWASVSSTFITSMDSLKVNHGRGGPGVIRCFADLSPRWPNWVLESLRLNLKGRQGSVREWITRLSKMGAADELTEQQRGSCTLILNHPIMHSCGPS
ncbi:Vacuolar protein sorting-associated protein 28 like 2 [Apostasia shenzhenica]|uniref:Vacuolar protein sorting-associated protein 28 like 2 n=1 Tax=Apostasia shenzhenica TaxID=1088818 RepID=A0A2I0A7Z0_9ASPA|nr:Vacuolar protein sorting-associated protein 28 like 2 [Apostasia shenzhenica]